MPTKQPEQGDRGRLQFRIGKEIVAWRGEDRQRDAASITDDRFRELINARFSGGMPVARGGQERMNPDDQGEGCIEGIFDTGDGGPDDEDLEPIDIIVFYPFGKIARWLSGASTAYRVHRNGLTFDHNSVHFMSVDELWCISREETAPGVGEAQLHHVILEPTSILAEDPNFPYALAAVDNVVATFPYSGTYDHLTARAVLVKDGDTVWVFLSSPDMLTGVYECDVIDPDNVTPTLAFTATDNPLNQVYVDTAYIWPGDMIRAGGGAGEVLGTPNPPGPSLSYNGTWSQVDPPEISRSRWSTRSIDGGWTAYETRENLDGDHAAYGYDGTTTLVEPLLVTGATLDTEESMTPVVMGGSLWLQNLYTISLALVVGVGNDASTAPVAAQFPTGGGFGTFGLVPMVGGRRNLAILDGADLWQSSDNPYFAPWTKIGSLVGGGIGWPIYAQGFPA